MVPQPNEEGIFQFQYQGLDGGADGETVVTLTSLASKDDTLDELSLFIAVQGVATMSGNSGVEFEVYKEGGGSQTLISGLADWALYCIIAFLIIGVCGCCFLGAMCWIAAGGELEEDELGTALQLAEKKRLEEERRMREDPYYMGEGQTAIQKGQTLQQPRQSYGLDTDAATRDRFQTAVDGAGYGGYGGNSGAYNNSNGGSYNSGVYNNGGSWNNEPQW